MEKLDEKKGNPSNTDQNDLKSDLEEMKKWADHSRKNQKSSIVNAASSKSGNKTEFKQKNSQKDSSLKDNHRKDSSLKDNGHKDNSLKDNGLKDKEVKKTEFKPEKKTETKSKTDGKVKSQPVKAESKPATKTTSKPQTNKKQATKPSANKQAVKKPAQKNKPQATAKATEKKRTLDQKLKGIKNQGVKKTGGKKDDGDKIHNYLLWATIAVIAIPCFILLYIIVGSRENSRSPVTGHRFKSSLDPEITEENLNALKSSLQFDQADEVEITLKSATLRINIDTKDDLSQEAITELVKLAYDKVNEKLPITEYFTNKKNGDETMKMYDLEISAYNILLEDGADTDASSKQIHISRTKNAAADEPVDDVLSSPKDEQSAEEILNPDTSNPPKQDTQNEQ